jgi:hypothetical protein
VSIQSKSRSLVELTGPTAIMVQMALVILISLMPFSGTALAAYKIAQAKEPPIVTPAQATTDAKPGKAPADAKVLFDGTDNSAFVDAKGNPADWKVADGVMTAGKADVISKHQFSDAQIHLEFNLPVSGKGHGNSGAYVHELYEVQIIDSFTDNPYKASQQCASLYKVFPALVNVCKAPGKWQSYDIIFHGAKIDDAGKLLTPARFTVFHNGVLVQYNRPMFKGTGGAAGKPLVKSGPLKLQSHGSPVKYRNIWVRPIPAISESMGPANSDPLPAVKAGEKAAKVQTQAPGLLSPNDAAAKPPTDAVVLFDGVKASGLRSEKGDAQTVAWKIKNGYMEVTRGTGSTVSKEKFSDVQMHVEWATPTEVKGNGQGRGNSGVYIHGTETQVLDSYGNKTYFDGQAAAIYKQYAPLVNACRPPGKWQSYDIIYRTAKYDEKGNLASPGTITVMHNGVVVQDHVINKKTRKKGSGNKITGNLSLQDHGNPVRYRNIWYRPLN